jgi:hypothetical protein
MSIRKRGNRYWIRFMWRGKWIEKSTGQGNAKVARQIEAAYRLELATNEHGLVRRPQSPTLRAFGEESFRPYIAARFTDKPKTREYYEYGLKCLISFDPLANTPIDAITSERIGAYVVVRKAAGNGITTINRQLQVLRRMFKLATKWKGSKQLLRPLRCYLANADVIVS